MMVALLVLAAVRARAELPAGLYAVSCGRAIRGRTRADALAACRREQRRDPLDERACACGRADLIAIAPDARPVFFVDACGLVGATRDALTAACEVERRGASPCACGENVRAVYGPFARRATRREFDDASVYRFLGDDGEWRDEQGVATCLAEGTPVLTPDGERAIEAIAVGDEVLSLGSGGALVRARVVRVKHRPPSPLLVLRLENGRELRVTANHPLQRRGAFKPAGELQPGDVVDTPSGEVAIASIADADAAPVYDLTVEPTHAFIAAGVAVHNY
jgi:hypothetical protein